MRNWPCLRDSSSATDLQTWRYERNRMDITCGTHGVGRPPGVTLAVVLRLSLKASRRSM